MKCGYARPVRGSVGLRARAYGAPACHAPLPTKTSRLVIQSFGRSPCFLRMCSHVFLVFLLDFSSLLIFVAIILSSVSLVFMTRSHLWCVSFVVCECSWMTRSHLRTHMRCADSEIRIWRSRFAPSVVFLGGWRASLGGLAALAAGMVRLPQPMIIPMEISGQWVGSWGHVFLARFQIVLVGVAVQ